MILCRSGSLIISVVYSRYGGGEEAEVVHKIEFLARVIAHYAHGRMKNVCTVRDNDAVPAVGKLTIVPIG